MEKIELNYYYGTETEQFMFYRIPKVLFTNSYFKSLSNDAKILYGLMLDRSGLSIKNEWFDENNRVYIIYTLEQVMESLNCGKDKGIKLFNELIEMGLIERIKRGCGKPAYIYVKKIVINCQFESSDDSILGIPIDNSLEEKKSNAMIFGKEKEQSETIEEIEVEKRVDSNKQNSMNRENRSLDVGKAEGNKKDKNNNNRSETNLSLSEHLGMKQNKVNQYQKFVKEHIEYEIVIQNYNKEEIDEIVDIIVETVCSIRESIKIGGVEYPFELVKSRLLKINYLHIQYVLECLSKTTNKIYNIKGYLLAALFNSTVTLNKYYQAEVNHDLYGGDS